MTIQDFERSLLALACWREAKQYSVDTMLCVASTIYNLALKNESGIGDAIVKHRELHGITSVDTDHPDPRDPLLAKLLRRIDDLFAPESSDMTNGAIYYLDMTKEEACANSDVLRNPGEHPMVALAGTIHFFK